MPVVEQNSKCYKLARQYHDELLQRRLKAGTPVESVRELAAKYNISTVTADKILKILAEENILLRVRQRGTFIKHDPPVLPRIGFACTLKNPETADPFRIHSIDALQRLTEKNCEHVIINYQELLDGSIEKKLELLNGLLLSSDFVDEHTLPVLRNFKGKIVMVENTCINETLPCSQVLPDFTDALEMFRKQFGLEHYGKFLILGSEVRNTVAVEREVVKFLRNHGVDERQIELRKISYSRTRSAEMAAYSWFMKNQELPSKGLYISLNGFFSLGMREAFHTLELPLPDLLSFDNVESIIHSDDKSCFFTDINLNAARIYPEAVDLLIKIIQENDDRRHIIKVPAIFIKCQSIKNH